MPDRTAFFARICENVSTWSINVEDTLKRFQREFTTRQTSQSKPMQTCLVPVGMGTVKVTFKDMVKAS